MWRMNADQTADELRTMKAELLDYLEHIDLVFIFQPFPYTAHAHKQSTLCDSIPAHIHQITSHQCFLVNHN